MNTLHAENQIGHEQLSSQVSRAIQRTRTIIMREKIPRGSWAVGNGVYITSGKYIRQDFNAFDFGKLQNTKNIEFSLYDDTRDEFIDLSIPHDISERLGEYFRNRKDIESDEQYRLPGGFKSDPVNCASFVHYVQGWFQNRPRKFSIQYIKTKEDEQMVSPGDVLYIHTGDECSGEYWHYLLYIGNGFCISKNGHSHLIVTRHHLHGMYRVIPKYS